MSRNVSDVKVNMAVYNLTGIGAVPQLAEKLHVSVLLLKFWRFYKFFCEL